MVFGIFINQAVNKFELPQVILYDKAKIVEMGNMLDRLINKLHERRNN